VISLTPTHEMPPKHQQLRAPRPKASANAFQALVDPPNDGNNLSFDGRDGKVDVTDGKSAVNALQRISAALIYLFISH
jgi:hypothetical protein